MFVTLEGIDGSGKSTILDILANHLRDLDELPLCTREPGGSGLGRKLRSWLLDAKGENLARETELFLFLADRAQHVYELIRPALGQDQIVLCDRFTDSTLAYQGHGRNMEDVNLEKMCEIASLGLVPDLTLLLDLPARMGLGRVLQRKHQAGTSLNDDRFDSESVEFHERVRHAYLKLAKKYPDRIKVIDAANGLERVSDECIHILDEKRLEMRGLNAGWIV